MKFSLVNYKQVFKTNRWDAEYFQPQYESISRGIQSYYGGCDTLDNLVDVSDAKYQPKKKQTYKYIELSNINGGEITGCAKDEGQNLPTRARQKVSAGDVIVSSIEGSLDSIALVVDEYDNALCSTGFHVVKSGGGNKRRNLTRIFAE